MYLVLFIAIKNVQHICKIIEKNVDVSVLYLAVIKKKDFLKIFIVFIKDFCSFFFWCLIFAFVADKCHCVLYFLCLQAGMTVKTFTQ